MLDVALEGKEYLVGNKCSYADLSFVTWYELVGYIDKSGEIDKAIAEYKNFTAWMDRLKSRPAVKKVLAERAAKSSH